MILCFPRKGQRRPYWGGANNIRSIHCRNTITSKIKARQALRDRLDVHMQKNFQPRWETGGLGLTILATSSMNFSVLWSRLGDLPTMNWAQSFMGCAWIFLLNTQDFEKNLKAVHCKMQNEELLILVLSVSDWQSDSRQPSTRGMHHLGLSVLF